MRFNLLIAFLIAFLAAVSFPSSHLLYFAPYLILCIHTYSRFKAMCCSMGSGLVMDLLSSFPVFGMTALNYSLVTALLYSQKRNFFEDKVSTLPIMTILFSTLSTILQACFCYYFSSPLKLSISWIFTDLIGMPICDALYALIAFSLPFQIIRKLAKLKNYLRREK